MSKGTLTPMQYSDMSNELDFTSKQMSEVVCLLNILRQKLPPEYFMSSCDAPKDYLSKEIGAIFTVAHNGAKLAADSLSNIVQDYVNGEEAV